MVFPSLLVAVLAAAPIKLAAPGFNAVDVDPKRADFLVDYLADQLSSQGGVRITTKSEIAAILGMERQRELLGCSKDGDACLTELSGALGVDALVVGNVVKVGNGTAVTLKIMRATSAEAIASASGRFEDDGKILDWMRELAPGFVRRLREAFPRERAGGVAAAPVTPQSVSTESGFIAPRMNRFLLGPITLGYERWVNDLFAFGLQGHIAVGPRFLVRPQFTVGAYGGAFGRVRFLQAGAVEMSAMITAGYGAVQDYDGTFNRIANGWLVAPAVELSLFRIGIAVETPIVVVRTFGHEFFIPVFLRFSYALPF